MDVQYVGKFAKLKEIQDLATWNQIKNIYCKPL